MRPVVYLSCAVLLVACEDPEGVDLRLVPDPNLNSEAQVLEALDRIVLVVDSPDGLYPPGSERATDGVQIEDADADPSDLELVATIPVPSDRLPLVRLTRGTLPDVALELRFLGVPAEPGAPASVVGRVQGVQLGRPIEELAIPFNLRPELLPPRVTEVLPGDGAAISGCEVPRLYVMFSRPLDPATIIGAITIAPGTLDEVRLDPSGLTAELRVSGLSGAGDAPLRWSLSIAASVTDLDGRPLDQVASEPGPQPYDGSFEVTCGPSMENPDDECGGMSGGPMRCPFGRLACVDGYCVPAACDFAGCGGGTVCDPATGRCTLDCRPWGEAEVCPEARPRCGEDGVCAP